MKQGGNNKTGKPDGKSVNAKLKKGGGATGYDAGKEQQEVKKEDNELHNTKAPDDINTEKKMANKKRKGGGATGYDADEEQKEINKENDELGRAEKPS